MVEVSPVCHRISTVHRIHCNRVTSVSALLVTAPRESSPPYVASQVRYPVSNFDSVSNNSDDNSVAARHQMGILLM